MRLKDTWIEVEESDPKRDDLNDPLKCKNCGVYFDFAMKHFDKFIGVLEEPEPEPEPDLPLTPEELENIEESIRQTQIALLTEAGFLDEDGEPTDAYYRESDYQYDCHRERTYR